MYEKFSWFWISLIKTLGTFFVAQAVANIQIQQKKPGTMVFIGSMSGNIVNYPQPQCAYNASKAAVIHLAKSLACEWAPHNIRVNTISPGYMNTAITDKFDPNLKKTWYERTPMGRMGHVTDLNGAAVVSKHQNRKWNKRN